jgi:hypothetical protein
MQTRLKQLLIVSALTIAVQVLTAGTAFAHHVFISGTAACAASGSGIVVNYVATTDSGPNPQVNVYLNGSLAATGAFTLANNYQFSGTIAAPSGAAPGDTLILSIVAVGTWAWDNFPGGQEGAVLVTIDESLSCNTTAPGTGRFTGGGKQVDVGVAKVTRGLTIHCDLKLSNNLEINWGVGENFHMTLHTAARCSDDPAIDQRPPAAPVDTIVGVGTGRYNNVDGYTVLFTIVDAGEPGVNDMMGMRIYETANPSHVVLDVPLSYLTNGNLQAHYDQPHKK